MSLKAIAIVAVVLLATVSVYHIQFRKSNNSEEFIQTGAPEYDLEVEVGSSHYVPNYDLMFQSYKKSNNLKFGASENTKRYDVFVSNVKIAEEHNAKNSSYKLGVTSLTHLTNEEFAALKLGYEPENRTIDPADIVDYSSFNSNTSYGFGNQFHVDYIHYHHITEEFDWVRKGAVTPIKNQGACECCWAFSATGALEGLHFINTKKLVDLSEQELVDCSTSFGNHGCSGGYMASVFDYAYVYGVSTQESYPFTGVDGKCRRSLENTVIRTNGQRWVFPNRPDDLVAAISKQPVSVAINADSEHLQLYKSGVLSDDACTTNVNHAVLAVGYGKMDGIPFFKIKNSWGTQWGNKGYVYLERTKGHGTCGINRSANYPTMEYVPRYN